MGYEQVWTLSPLQRKLNKEYFGVLSGKMGLPAEAYPGEIIPGLEPEMIEARESLQGILGGMGEFDVSTRAALDRALSGAPSYKLDPETTKEFFEKGVKAPLLREFEKSIKPRIEEAFSGSKGFFSSRRPEAQARALGDLSTTMASELSRAVFANQQLEASLAESAQNRQLGAIPLAEQFASRDISRAGQLMTVSAPFQDLATRQAGAKYSEWLRTRPEASPWLKYGMAYLDQSQMALVEEEDEGGGSGLFSGLGAVGGAFLGTLLAGPGMGTYVGAGMGAGIGASV